MIWRTLYMYIPKYEYVSTNQHGDRYKQTGTKQVNCIRLETAANAVADLGLLILLSHTLNVPVHYDFKAKPQVAYIEVLSKEAVERGI